MTRVCESRARGARRADGRDRSAPQRLHAAAGGVHVGGDARVGARASLRGRLGVRGPRGRSGGAGANAGRCASADDAIVLVRDDDGRLRAFYNVCRHRGHELMPCGATARTSAPSTARTTDGPTRSTARSARRRASTRPPDFDAAAYGLVPVRVEEWHGWAMVNVSGDAPPLADWTGGLDDLIAPYGCADLVVAATPRVRRWPPTGSCRSRTTTSATTARAIHPELCVVSPPTSGANFDLPGAWFGGTMDLGLGRETMSMSGKSGASPLPGLDAAPTASGAVRRPVPELLAEPAPRLRHDPSHRAARAPANRGSSASGCSRGRPSSARASTRPTPSTSGT